MAFLEIMTRTFAGRPRLLDRCKSSLKRLRDPDWSQTIIMDHERRGVHWANRNLSTVDASGQYVWVLDDDDQLCYADLVGDLKSIVKAQRPDVIMVRSYHALYGLLPPYELWEQRPVMGKCGGSCVIVSRETWQQFREGWTEVYAGDFWYINGLWDARLSWAWLPVIACWQTQQSRGAAEVEV